MSAALCGFECHERHLESFRHKRLCQRCVEAARGAGYRDPLIQRAGHAVQFAAVLFILIATITILILS
ncbi:hypothetical protein [Amycolatopsis sp. lyj-84]|uniref:hypothetical protein n=1 Tax=Amycolatopsis sp. lyj-84 TaxID=2789284 RepID=UPI00397E7FFE